MNVQTGLERLVYDNSIQQQYKGNVALLCHNASVTGNLTHAAVHFKNIFGERFTKLFGPQHGFATDVQDNMVETDHIIHPYFKIPVYSLYSETRIPTDEMLQYIDHLFIDLQDVGCRIYTYIYTLTLLLDKCTGLDIEVIILDRPNPIGGTAIEGNTLEHSYTSFVGLHPIPVRHGMTIAEVGLMHQKQWAKKTAQLSVISMQGWKRSMYYSDTGLPWLLPSPNLPREESALTFPATVLFEGTQLSEGRGTTQSLEIIGHPSIRPFEWHDKYFSKALKESKLEGVVIRPINFLTTFQKHKDNVCGGFQIHVTDRNTFQPWRVGQFMMRELYHLMGEDFLWKQPPYEYNNDLLPIDIINGTNQLREWVVSKGKLSELNDFENIEKHQLLVEEIKLYDD